MARVLSKCRHQHENLHCYVVFHKCSGHNDILALKRHRHMNDPFEQTILVTAGIDENADFLPLMSPDEEESMNKEVFPDDLPILPLRNNVLFPGVMIPI